MALAEGYKQFLNAAVRTLSFFDPDIEIKCFKPKRASSLCDSAEYVFYLDFFGDLEGRAIFELTSQTAKAFTNMMCYGEVVADEETVTETITELGNLITARASILLDNKGTTIDISSPELVDSENCPFAECETIFIQLPLDTSYGKLKINVGIESD